MREETTGGRREPFGRTPGPLAALVLTVVSAGAAFFWWIAVIGPLGGPGAVLVAGLLGRGAVAVAAAGRDRDALGLRRPRSGSLLPAILLAPMLPLGLEIQAAVFALAGRSPSTVTFHVDAGRLTADAPAGPVVALLAAALALPLGTELLFRGVVQRGLVKRWGRWPGLLAAAALGAAAHSALLAATGALMIAVVLSAFAWGVVLGHLKEASGSVVPPLVTHVLMGLAWWALATLPSTPLPLVGAPGGHVPLPLLIGPAVLVAVGLWMLRGAATESPSKR